MRLISVALIAGFVLIATVACSSSEEALPTPEPSTPTPTSQRGAESTQQDKSFDDLMVEIEDEVPGFAGMTENGTTLQVRLTRRDVNMDALRTAIVSYFPQLAALEIQVVDVTFYFGQLSAWYQPVQDALYADPDVAPHMVSTDIDEVQNRIVISVDTEDAVRAAEREIAKLGLPDGAVQVILAERARSALGCVVHPGAVCYPPDSSALHRVG